GGETRRRGRDLVGMSEIPVDQRIKRGEPAKPVALAAIVGNAGCGGQVGRGHCNAQCLRRCRRRRDKQQGRGDGRQACSEHGHLRSKVEKRNVFGADAKRGYSTVTLVKSWYQLCAGWKPLTLADIALGFRS